MSIDFQVESLVECYMECDALMHDYYEKTNAHEGVPPLAFNWPHYLALDHQHMLLLVTARNGSQLAGFVLYIIAPHPQYKPTIWAVCNTLAVSPSFRSMGVARSLMATAEPMLRDRKCERVLHGFRHIYNTEPLFPKLGYEPFETMYSKACLEH